MFICGYHFPASEGNDIAFDKVVAKVEEAVSGTTINTVKLTGENSKGQILEEITLEDKDTFMFKALVDYYNKSDIEGDSKMLFYTNKYQISEISKSVDGDKTKDICKKFDDMNLYRITVA
jgi:hypothetical protein